MKDGRYSAGLPADITADEKILLAHIGDMLRRCERDRKPQFTRFLSEREIMLAECLLRSSGYTEHRFFGGYEDALRKQLCIYGECDPVGDGGFPLCAVLYKCRFSAPPSHSAFLGALIASGLERDMIGDIIVGNDGAYVFVCENAADDALSLERAGKVPLKAEKCGEIHIDRKDRFEEMMISVSSLRADCVLAAVSKLSRDKAAAFIRSEGAEINSRKVYAPDKTLEEGDTFSARGKGKYLVCGTEGRTKKDRFRVLLKKYR